MSSSELDYLARRIKEDMAVIGMSSLSLDEAHMLADMSKQPAKLRSVLESFQYDDPKPGVAEIYRKFCGGVQ